MRYLRHDLPPPPALFVDRHFLAPDLCDALVADMRQGAHLRAQVENAHGDGVTNLRVRRTCYARIGITTAQLIAAQLDAQRHRIEHYFSTSLGPVQLPQFLHYQRGDFFRPHQDCSSNPAHDVDLRARKISAVVFLNRHTRLPSEHGYCGGELRLYRIDDEPTDPGMCIAGEPGLLIAFRADVVHEVRPVTHGERFTVVTWYVEAQP